MATARKRDPVPAVGDLDRHLPFQRREWQAQRVGWLLLSGLVLAALAGLFGDGPLSSAEARSPRGDLRVFYDRFTRAGAATRLVLDASPSSGPLDIRFSRALLETSRIEAIVPPPETATAEGDAIVYRFAEGTTRVIVEYEPVASGRHELSVARGTGAAVTLWQLAYF